MTQRLSKLAQCLYDGNYQQAIQYHNHSSEKPSNQYEYLLLAKAYFCGQHYSKCIQLLNPIKNKTQNPKIFFQTRLLLYKARYLNGQKTQGTLDNLKDSLYSSKSKIKKQYTEYHIWSYEQVISIQKFSSIKKSAFITKQSLLQERDQFKQLYQKNDDNSAIMEGMPAFLISSRWYQLWEAYTAGNSRVQGQNPGPISNFQILDHIYNSFYDNRSQKLYTNNYLFQPCRYKILPKKCWQYLYEKYGGIEIKRFNIASIDKPNQIMTEVYLKRIVILPSNQLTEANKNFDDHWKIVQLTKKQTWKGLTNKLSYSWGSNPKICQFSKNSNKFEQVNMNQFLQDCDTIGKKYIFTPNSQNKNQVTINKKQKCANLQCKNEKLLKFCQCKTVKYCCLDCLKQDRDRHRKKCQLELQHIKQKSVVLQNFNLSEKAYSGRKGLVGLRNLGNTCYMNSGLQCLSNTKQLTEYFMSNNFLKDINSTNPLGTKGHLACAYAELIRQMWTGSDDVISPFQLKKMIGKFAGQFSGYGQQDSQEFISYLIDGLQEDLNLVKKKQTFESNDQIRPDQQASLQSQRNYSKRIQSYIRDLMAGQFKSTVQCLSCKKISICFDPFLLISMPIPNPKIVSAYILFDDLSLSAIKVNIQITQGTTFQQFQKQIQHQYKQRSTFFFVKLHKQTFQIKKVIQNHQKQLIKDWIKEDQFLFCYQRPAPQKNTEIFFADFYYKKERIGFGRFISFPKNCSQKQRNQVIEDSYSRASKKSYGQIVQTISKEQLPSEYEKVWDKYFVLTFKRQMNLLTFKQNQNFQLTKKDGKKQLTLYDCLSAYSQKQLLQKDNQWYCNKCKQFRPAQKQMEIYKTNKILVLAFKRFTRVRKIRTFVDFPIAQLDMGPYIKSNKINKSIIYDLYGVVNHYGSLGGGHYTAYCQNYLNKRWYQFNDSRVSQVNRRQIATGDSYVLFYRLRS